MALGRGVLVAVARGVDVAVTIGFGVAVGSTGDGIGVGVADFKGAGLIVGVAVDVAVGVAVGVALCVGLTEGLPGSDTAHAEAATRTAPAAFAIEDEATLPRTLGYCVPEVNTAFRS